MITRPTRGSSTRNWTTPLRDVLLGQQHLDDAVAAVAVALLDRLERALHVREVLVRAGVRRDQSLDLLRGEQRVADDLEAS